MEKCSRETKAGKLEVPYEAKLKPVVDAIVENLETRDEVGANVAITLECKCVLDSWGG